MSAAVVVLTGGVGGAKLLLGLARIMPADRITAIVNTADDFRHFGLHVSPDIDTVLYTLSGKANREQGWGRQAESWSFMSALRELGGADWFALGDGDLALHVLRSWQIDQGMRLSDVTRGFASAYGIDATILPMSDDLVATMLETDAGALEFQDYFVARRCTPRVHAISFAGVASARPGPGVLNAISQAQAILIAPSNPYLSIDPILAVPGIRQALKDTNAPVVAVSPLVAGQAVKGPTAKLMVELGQTVSNEAIVEHYSDVLNALLIDQGDDAPPGIHVGRTDTLMNSLEDRIRVAKAAMALTRE